MLTGFCIAMVVGISLGVLAGTIPNGKLISLLLDFFRSIPPIAWTPLAILFMGIGEKPAIFVVFIGGIFPIFTNTFEGIKAFPEIYKNTAATYKIKGARFFYKLLFPFTLPYIFSGLKIGMGMCWMCLIAAEMISAENGLGYFIQINRLLLRTDYVVMGMLVIALIGLALLKCMDFIQNRLIPWNK